MNTAWTCVLLAAIVPCASCTEAQVKGDAYYFDMTSPTAHVARARVIERIPGGKCDYSFGIPDRGNQLVLTVTRSTRFVRLRTGAWNLSVPLSRPIEGTWSDEGEDYAFLGNALVSIGGTTVGARKILDKGDGLGSTEILYSERYGILGFRYPDSNVEYRVERLPVQSLLSCAG